MPWLICTTGDDRGLAHETNADGFVLGRAADCDIQLVEPQASRYHCKVAQSGSKLIVEDMGSTNGIKHRGKRVRGKRVKLKEGDSFAIGNDVFLYSKTHDSYLEATQDVLKDLTKHSRSGVFEQTCSMVMNKEMDRKKTQKKGFLARLFGKK